MEGNSKFALHAHWSLENGAFKLSSELRGGQLSVKAKPGDQVIAIDDQKIGPTMQDFMKMLKGPVGSEVKITFFREGTAEDIEFDAVITRTDSEFQDVQAAVMYALLPEIKGPAKQIIDDGNLDSALWTRVTTAINDIKIKAEAAEAKVAKLQTLVKEQQGRIQEGAELLEEKHKEMKTRIQQGLEHLRRREEELQMQIKDVQQIVIEKDTELQEERSHHWWEKLQQLQRDYDEMTLENQQLHSDALAGVTITLEMDEKSVRALNGRENRRRYQKQLGQDTCRALKLHSGRIQVIGTRVRAGGTATAMQVDFDCTVLPKALSPKEPSAMVLAEQITHQALEAESPLRQSGNLGLRIRKAAQRDPHEFIDNLRSSVLDQEAKLSALQDNIPRPVTVIEQRSNGNGNSSPPSIIDPLSYLRDAVLPSPRDTPRVPSTSQTQRLSPLPTSQVKPYIESLERQQRYVHVPHPLSPHTLRMLSPVLTQVRCYQEIESENEDLKGRMAAMRHEQSQLHRQREAMAEENETLQQEVLRAQSHSGPFSSPRPAPAADLRTQISPRHAYTDPRAGRIPSPQLSAGVGGVPSAARRYVSPVRSDDEVAA